MFTLQSGALNLLKQFVPDLRGGEDVPAYLSRLAGGLRGMLDRQTEILADCDQQLTHRGPVIFGPTEQGGGIVAINGGNHGGDSFGDHTNPYTLYVDGGTGGGPGGNIFNISSGNTTGGNGSFNFHDGDVNFFTDFPGWQNAFNNFLNTINWGEVVNQGPGKFNGPVEFNGDATFNGDTNFNSANVLTSVYGNMRGGQSIVTEGSTETLNMLAGAGSGVNFSTPNLVIETPGVFLFSASLSAFPESHATDPIHGEMITYKNGSEVGGGTYRSIMGLMGLRDNGGDIEAAWDSTGLTRHLFPFSTGGLLNLAAGDEVTLVFQAVLKDWLVWASSFSLFRVGPPNANLP